MPRKITCSSYLVTLARAWGSELAATHHDQHIPAKASPNASAQFPYMQQLGKGLLYQLNCAASPWRQDRLQPLLFLQSPSDASVQSYGCRPEHTDG